jgi:hypothetical protein
MDTSSTVGTSKDRKIHSEKLKYQPSQSPFLNPRIPLFILREL